MSPLAELFIRSFLILKFVLVWFWWLFLLLGLFIWRKRLKRFPIEAVIIERRGDHVISTNDRLGKVFGLDGLHKYMFKLSKDTIPIMEFDWILHNVVAPTNLAEKLINLLQGSAGKAFIFKYGSKQYKPVRIELPNSNPGFKEEFQEIKEEQTIKKRWPWSKPTPEKREPKYMKVYEPLDMAKYFDHLKFDVMDWDNMNFMIQEHRATFERRKRQQERWEKAMPYVILGMCILVFIISIYFGYNFIRSAWQAGSGAVQQQKASQPSFPVIGELFTPGK